jgi:hypothetical protein
MRATPKPSATTPRDRIEPEGDRELRELRLTCWRQTQEINSLNDTVAILRAGANRLAADNAFMNAALAVADR